MKNKDSLYGYKALMPGAIVALEAEEFKFSELTTKEKFKYIRSALYEPFLIFMMALCFTVAVNSHLIVKAIYAAFK